MKLNPEEISSIIKDKLEKYSNVSTISDIGTVMQVSDSIVRIYGLKNAKQSELLKFKNNTYGVVLNLEEDNIGAILLNNNQNISEGDEVETTGEIIDIPVGNCLLGRVIDPLGNPIDGKGPIKATKYRPIENIATNVTSRQPVNTPLQTGIKAIDSMIPIGRGQRELIIGDKQTGKTSIAIDTIINQKGKNVKCIYVAIGQKSSTVANIRKTLEDNNAMDYTTIVCATASDIVSLQYIAPYAGCAIGEEYMFNGEDALIVYDDLTKHAASYRTISLLLHRPSGREAYPGDVFFLHSRLLERSAKLSSNLGGGSLTALPIVETQAGDISSYIPTNIISITDGQIYLDTELFNEGFRPAITPGLSVSRVGGNAQIKAMKELSSTIRINLAQYKELESFAKFGADLDNTSKEILKQGACIKEILKQDKCSPIDVAEQILIIYACINKHLIDLKVEDIASFERTLIKSVKEEHNDIIEEIHTTKTLSQESKQRLNKIINNCKQKYQK